MVGFPTKYCRVVATRVDGDDAVVLLNTGSASNPYLYEVKCTRRRGQWVEEASGNGWGWTRTDDRRQLGACSFWGEAPADVDMVRVELEGQVQEEHAVDGAYLAVWWRQPEPWGPPPKLIAFRVRGTWVACE